MTRRIVATMSLVVSVVAIALAVPMAWIIASDQRASFVSGLQVRTLALAGTLALAPEAQWPAIVDSAQVDGGRIVVTAPDSVVIADSDGTDVGQTFDRPEIQAALDGQVASGVRESQTLGTPLRYVAAPIAGDKDVAGAVRVSLRETDVDAVVRRSQMWLLVFVIAVSVVAGLVGWLLASAIARPVVALADSATRLADDLRTRADEQAGPPEVRAVAVALNATAGRLRTMIEGAQRVAADASHHLRTPLAGVRLRLEAIDDTSSEPQTREQAAEAIDEVDRLTHRIDQVLALTRAESAPPLRREDAAAVVQDRCAAASGLAAERDVAIQVTTTPAVVEVPAGTVARVVDELLGNALQYARHIVNVGLAGDGPWAVLTVEDDGPGFPAGSEASVFGRFVRGENAAPGGTGLGLALVDESARAAGGSASVDPSRPGGCVVVRWPLAGQGQRPESSRP